jgi:hypothetical protein
MAWHHFVGYLAAALMLRAIIGAERQWHQRIAGLRTNALVSGGVAMFVSISHLVPLTPTSLQVAAQVVSGIGFLGAGVIVREGLSIRGSTLRRHFGVLRQWARFVDSGSFGREQMGPSECLEQMSCSDRSLEKLTGNRALPPKWRPSTCFG